MAAIMLQGTGSDVGKSVLVAGLCRALANRGLRVLPFKPQNMSNNAAVTIEQGEIGRAQALQALACRVPAHADMNPVLLKPQSDIGAQVIVQGQMKGTFAADHYQDLKPRLLQAVLDSFDRLQSQADIVVVEGAGSPAETNLRAGDIANMGFALAAHVPVILVGDIDRGGVIASLVGTKTVLDNADRAAIKGFIINKFRGDIRLFDDGYRDIERRTGWQGFGVLPWLHALRRLPSEDALVLDKNPASGPGQLHIAIPILSRISNFDDFDPLKLEPRVRLTMVPPGDPLPGDADVVILPGTKATIADLAFLRAQGWDIDLQAHHRRGGHILGLCGGYQILGQEIHDPQGIEGPAQSVKGLGYLDIETEMTTSKMLRNISGTCTLNNTPLSGYLMHVGRTFGPGLNRPFLHLDDGITDGAVSSDSRVSGCCVHGLFTHTDQRGAWLKMWGVGSSGQNYAESVDKALDEIADAMEISLNIDGLLYIAKSGSPVIRA